jgi:hypothetical protein
VVGAVALLLAYAGPLAASLRTAFAAAETAVPVLPLPALALPRLRVPLLRVSKLHVPAAVPRIVRPHVGPLPKPTQQAKDPYAGGTAPALSTAPDVAALAPAAAAAPPPPASDASGAENIVPDGRLQLYDVSTSTEQTPPETTPADPTIPPPAAIVTAVVGSLRTSCKRWTRGCRRRRGNSKRAAKELQSFIAFVNGKSGSGIDPAYAALLVNWASDAITHL